MKDKSLERNYAALQEFIKMWLRFKELYESAACGTEVTPELETEFLEVKSRIARRYENLIRDLGLQQGSQDRTMDIISQMVSLESASNMQEMSMKKLQSEWHGSYIAMNKALGSLEVRREELARVSAAGTALKGFFTHPMVIIIIVVAALVAAYTLLLK